MSSSASPSSNVGAASAPASAADEAPDADRLVLVGGRATQEEAYLVDRAALELNVSRARFVVDAALKEARDVLAKKGVTL